MKIYVDTHNYLHLVWDHGVSEYYSEWYGEWTVNQMDGDSYLLNPQIFELIWSST